MLGMLLLSGFAAGFKTKMCDHYRTVEAIKKTYDCFLESFKELLKKGINKKDERINLDNYIMNAKKSYRMTLSLFI